LGPEHTEEHIPENSDFLQTEPGLYHRLDNVLQKLAVLRFKKIKDVLHLPTDLKM